jgi:phosphoribosylformimino-5-aminoimidazole carboxamide ribonucleotide (ProFAR) isomerase
MRVGSTVLLQNQKCVQSYNWKTMRSLGDIQGILNSLEEYQCDEVAIIRPVRVNDTLAKFKEDIEVLHCLKTMTPISFGGGIRTADHLVLLKDLPVERLVFSSAFILKNQALIEVAKNLFGHQAIQCLLPIQNQNGNMQVYCSYKAVFIPLAEVDFEFIQSYANEVILFDISHEGASDKFDFELVNQIPLSNDKLIISGGIGFESIKTAYKLGFASVLIDNKVLHEECSITRYKYAAKMS